MIYRADIHIRDNTLQSFFSLMLLQEEMARRKKAEELARQRAEREARQSKAEEERVQRSVAGVNHLEIPAELAFILSKVSGEC